MSENGYYYLHTNGDLIWKSYRPDHSDFVRRVWPCYVSDRGYGWVILIEALALGARRTRIDELAHKWGMDNDDAQEFCKRAGLRVFRDGSGEWCAVDSSFVNLQESRAGFGPTALYALADYARQGLMGV